MDKPCGLFRGDLLVGASAWRVSVGQLLLVSLTLAGCGAGNKQGGLDPLSGQVSSVAAAPATKISLHAASRFLEQATFGPSPKSVQQLQTLGFESWIDAQLKIPASLIATPEPFRDPNDPKLSALAKPHHNVQLMNMVIGSDDDLRVKVSWALSNFLVVSTNKIASYGGSEFFNTLQANAFGNYRDLLKAVTRQPAMGFFLDNGQNRRQALNENYGRELMQLFSIGLVQLNIDGSWKRGADGRPLENYQQADVVGATRALSGWNYDPRPRPDGSPGGFNYGYPMVPSPNGDDHDPGEKLVLGRTIPPGQGAEKDLDSLISILMDHPSMAPFVSLRLIQNLTTSAPSPDYLRRVATTFRDTGGDLARTVKAILLDPDARAGDDPARTSASFGRIKEPLLLHASLLRGLGCRVAPLEPTNPIEPWMAYTQVPVAAFSVFNFHQPTHRAPGSNLLAPEQKMLDALEFGRRLSDYNGFMSRGEVELRRAGCEIDLYINAAGRSDDVLIDLLSIRYFRGRIPAAVRAGLKTYTAESWLRASPLQLLGAMFEIMSLTPTFGAIR